jgi:dolichyl-phosphate beta-glucosyltransferase
MSKVVYVVPVHNEEKVLASNVGRLTTYLERRAGAEVFLIENGSRDASWELSQELAAKSDGNVPVRAFREENAGIGYAYHRGLEEAVARFGTKEPRWAILTAADLPFGFSDLEAVLLELSRSPSRILMGSKAHRESRAPTGMTRTTMSSLYRVARRIVVGMRVGDSQGSVFIRLDLAAELMPKITARGFFYSTELCHYAERAGETILEVPVTLEISGRASTVRPVKDGLQMARQLWQLRKQGRR